ncbi:MATE family efflux transporter [Selenomonas sp. F0473]|uniref:MATE family efflux transporter n=1 Tax=Selenomonas sp. F0473 TaxID=999423 RepID=UPI00056BC0FC|nr:MATE family efflux transporter [Selenomonas sp. F0473]
MNIRTMKNRLCAMKRKERIYGIHNPLAYDFLHHNLHHLHVLLFESADQQDFTSGPILRQLLVFMFPILLTQLLQQFYTIADTAIVGQTLGAESLAAVGTAGLILSVIVNFFIGCSAGLSVLVSHLYGAHSYEKLNTLVQTIFVVVLVFSIFFTFGGLAAIPAMLAGLNTPEDIVPLAAAYLGVSFLGMLAQLFYNTATAILRALGNTTSALRYLFIAVVLNIALDVLLLIVFPLGIKGAAIATVVSQYAAAALVLHKIFHLHGAWRFTVRRPLFHAGYLAPIVRMSIPAGMQAVFMSVSSLVIQGYINSFGYAAMAGMTVYARVEGFLYYPLFAFGIALTSFIGQNVGAAQFDRVRRGVRASLRAVVGGSALMAAIASFFAPQLIALFTNDAATVRNSLEAVYWTMPFYWLYGINQVYIGAIRGLGDTFYPMLTSLAAYSIFRVAWCYAWDLVGIHSMLVVYNAYNASFLVMIALLCLGWKRGLRRKLGVRT